MNNCRPFRISLLIATLLSSGGCLSREGEEQFCPVEYVDFLNENPESAAPLSITLETGEVVNGPVEFGSYAICWEFEVSWPAGNALSEGEADIGLCYSREPGGPFLSSCPGLDEARDSLDLILGPETEFFSHGPPSVASARFQFDGLEAAQATWETVDGSSVSGVYSVE